jgi:hypothetical protein
VTSAANSSRQRPNKSPRAAVYDSAIDLWIAALIFLGPTFACAIGVALVINARPAEASILFLTAAVTLIVTVALTLPCRYTILDDALSIRCGLICYQIDLRDIRVVEPTSSLRSGPALSLRRVLVATDRRKHILSPKDRERFIEQLSDAIRRVGE